MIGLIACNVTYMTVVKWFTTYGSTPKTGWSIFVKKKLNIPTKINYGGHSTSAPDFLSRPKMNVNSLNLVYKQLHVYVLALLFYVACFAT